MEDFEGNTAYAFYDTFSLGDENSNYALTASGYQGDAGKNMREYNHNNIDIIYHPYTSNTHIKICQFYWRKFMSVQY